MEILIEDYLLNCGVLRIVFRSYTGLISSPVKAKYGVSFESHSWFRVVFNIVLYSTAIY